MKKLLQMILLFALVLTALCCCGGGDMNKALDEGEFLVTGVLKVMKMQRDEKRSGRKRRIKISEEKAHAFMRRQKRSYPYSERYYEMFKSPMEMKQEQCEHYAPCDFYSDIVGFHTAYRYYFGSI